MHILITGATGFIGSHLTTQLLGLGHTVSIVSRKAMQVKKKTQNSVQVITREELSPKTLSGIECVVHLAGAPINTFPWNKKNKEKIYSSRIKTTKCLVSNLPESCHTFICGSAMGYYPSDLHKEYTTSFINTTPQSFMEQLCVDWEKEAYTAKTENRRVITLRTGIVLGPEKLGKILHLTTKRFGGIILGSGNQRMPLISLEERVNRCISIIHNNDCTGPINMVSENMQHKAYIQTLAKKLHRPVWLRIPETILTFFLGEMSQLIIGSRKIRATIIK